MSKEIQEGHLVVASSRATDYPKVLAALAKKGDVSPEALTCGRIRVKATDQKGHAKVEVEGTGQVFTAHRTFFKPADHPA